MIFTDPPYNVPIVTLVPDARLEVSSGAPARPLRFRDDFVLWSEQAPPRPPAGQGAPPQTQDTSAELAVWCRSLTDRLAFGLPPATLDRMRDAFLTSSRYELAFWQMAWDQERWPA